MPGRRLGAVVASAIVYVAVTAVIGRNALSALDTQIISDAGDPVLNAALLVWNAITLPWSGEWFRFPAFYPVPDVLTFSEHLLGLSVVSTPLYWVTGDALTTYNLTLLLTYPLCGLAMYALVWRLTGNAPASFLSGLAFAFAPYRATQLAHVQVLAVFWAPLALLGLHGYLDTGRRRWLVLFSACWMLQGAANGYFLVFFSFLVGLWVLWFVVAQRRWHELVAIAVATVIGALPLAPILWRYLQAHAHYGFSRGTEEIASFGADIASGLCAPTWSSNWAWLRVACRGEGELFPGVALFVVCLLGIWGRSRKHVAWFYGMAAGLTWVLSWGPAPTLLEEPAPFGGPYALLMSLPGMSSLRVPARFWMMTVLCLSVLMGVLVAEFLKRRRPAIAWPVAALAACGLLFDGWVTMPVANLRPGAPVPFLMRGGVAMTLPLGAIRDVDLIAQLEAIGGGWSTANGFSGYEPFHYERLRDASDQADPVVFAPFVARGPLHVVVDESASNLVALVEQQPGVTRIGTRNGMRQYLIPQATTVIPLVPDGELIPFASVSASCSPEMLPGLTDGDLTTRWHCGSQEPGQELTIDVGRVVALSAITTALGDFAPDAPRQLVVETSLDGAAWERAWEGAPHRENIEAEMRDPLAKPLTIQFAPRQARFVRLRQLARDPTFYWSIAELQLWAGTGLQGTR